MLRLRPYKPGDAGYLTDWLKDERTVRLWRADRFSYPLTKDQLEQYWEDFLSDDHAWIFLAVDEKGKPCGHFSFRRVDYVKNSAHMGFIVVNPMERGKGYGREMVTLALRYAFDILKVDRVTLGVFTVNEAAHRCYLSVGFKDEELHRDYDCFNGETWDYLDMAAAREDFLGAAVLV